MKSTQPCLQVHGEEGRPGLSRPLRRDDDKAEEDAGEKPNARAESAGKATGSASAGKGEPKLIYPKPEDQALHQLCSWSFVWPAAVPEATAVSDAQSKLTQMRLVRDRVWFALA